MKTLLSLGLAVLALTPVHAQIFGPHAANGALLGGIAGAVIGNNSGSHNGWQGAAIGAGVGALIGAANDHGDGYPGGGYGYYGGSAAQNGLWLGAMAGGIIGHNHGHDYDHHGGGDWHHHNNYYHNDGWRGAAWGAGAGWLLGSIIDANYGYYGNGYYDYGYPRTAVMPQPQPVYVQSAPQPAAPQQVTIINNYYGNASPMAGANSLFGR